jgi:hypothetical protein
MLQRGVIVSYETVRRWCATFGRAYANGLRRRRPRPGDKWHLDEVFIKVGGELKYLWRAVDQDGNVSHSVFRNVCPTLARCRPFCAPGLADALTIRFPHVQQAARACVVCRP